MDRYEIYKHCTRISDRLVSNVIITLSKHEKPKLKHVLYFTKNGKTVKFKEMYGKERGGPLLIR